MKLILVCFFVALNVCIFADAKKFDSKEKPDWAKKDISAYSEADLERIFDQWEEDEEPLPDDELPEHLRPQQPIDTSKLDPNNPESILELTKKGKTLMIFVTVANKPPKARTEEITKLWQTGLWNNHMQTERYLIDDDRAIFMFKDGSQSWVAKNYLIEQEECKDVTIEGKTYPGNYPDKRNTVIKIGDEL